MDQPGVRLRVDRGQHVNGGPRKESHLPPGPDHRGKGVARRTGLEHPGQTKAAKRRPPEL